MTADDYEDESGWCQHEGEEGAGGSDSAAGAWQQGSSSGAGDVKTELTCNF